MIDVAVLTILIPGVISIIAAIGKLIRDGQQNKSTISDLTNLLNDVKDLTSQIHIHIVNGKITVSPCGSIQNNEDHEHLNNMPLVPPSSPKNLNEI